MYQVGVQYRHSLYTVLTSNPLVSKVGYGPGNFMASMVMHGHFFLIFFVLAHNLPAPCKRVGELKNRYRYILRLGPRLLQLVGEAHDNMRTRLIIQYVL